MRRGSVDRNVPPGKLVLFRQLAQNGEGSRWPMHWKRDLTRLEARGDQASKKIVVEGDEAERDALMQGGCIPDRAVVIITGVCRAAQLCA